MAKSVFVFVNGMNNPLKFGPSQRPGGSTIECDPEYGKDYSTELLGSEEEIEKILLEAEVPQENIVCFKRDKPEIQLGKEVHKILITGFDGYVSLSIPICMGWIKTQKQMGL